MECVAFTFYYFPCYNSQVAELLKSWHQIQPLIPMEITLPGFEGSFYTDAHQRWDATLLRVSVRATYLCIVIPPKQIFPSKSSQKPEKAQVSSTLCFHGHSFTSGNKLKVVSLPSFLPQAGNLSTLRNKVGDGSIPLTFCLKWIFILSYQYWYEKRGGKEPE